MSTDAATARDDRPAIDVVIVNWNSGDFLRRCLASIADCVTPGLVRVIVVDNASSDDSMERLPFLPGMVARRNDENAGFARACNQGAACGSAPVVLFLNPDTVVRAGALERVAAFLAPDANRRFGICTVQLRGDDGDVARNTSRDPRPRDILLRSVFLDRLAPRLAPPHFVTDWDHRDSRVVDQIMGAFYAIRRPLFEQLGGFDERFFVYYEEVDLTVRARQAGSDVFYIADTHVVHTGCGTTDSVRAMRQFYVSRSRLLYAAKHFGGLGTAAAWLATLVLEPAARSAGFLVRGDWSSVRETVRAAGMLWAALPLSRSTPRAAAPAVAGIPADN
ncbi:MAG TPA: glycosyltransferase family 2 protein [Longimicrobiales bacterium]|nr:glycosyltransferase family 2 protein [Longimicrobiales bacterium]